MSNGITPLASLQGAEPAASAGVSGGVKSSGTSFAAAEPATPQAPLHPNPSFRIEPALGLVVMEFRNGAGAVSSSIPTVQQLDAYRRAAGHAAASSETGLPAAGTPAEESAASAQTASLVTTPAIG